VKRVRKAEPSASVEYEFSDGLDNISDASGEDKGNKPVCEEEASDVDIEG
jgi:hypothetical protein